MQPTIGADVAVDLSSSTSVLIKLARDHPAIDLSLLEVRDLLTTKDSTSSRCHPLYINTGQKSKD